MSYHALSCKCVCENYRHTHTFAQAYARHCSISFQYIPLHSMNVTYIICEWEMKMQRTKPTTAPHSICACVFHVHTCVYDSKEFTVTIFLFLFEYIVVHEVPHVIFVHSVAFLSISSFYCYSHSDLWGSVQSVSGDFNANSIILTVCYCVCVCILLF